MSASTVLYRDRRGNAFGIDINYYPYGESRFNSVATLPTRKAFVHGAGYGASLYLSTRYAGCSITFKSLTYKQDLSEKIGSFGCGFGISLF